MTNPRKLFCFGVAWHLAIGALFASEETFRDSLPPYLRDRGTGMSTSLMGTYIRPGQWLVFTSIEYERQSRSMYQGEELGYDGEIEYFGTFSERQARIFSAFGVTRNVSIEAEGAVRRTATLSRAEEDDTSGMPDRIRESGAGDVEVQIRWRLARETDRLPEVYAKIEVERPDDDDEKVLIGDSGWDAGVGVGAIKGFRWGTLAVRASLDYAIDERELALGEYAIEYSRRLSERWRVSAALEGEDDELAVFADLQWRIRPGLVARIDLGLGLTKGAADIASQMGVMFVF